MLGVTSGSELFWNRKDRTFKKMSSKFEFNYLSTKTARKSQLKDQPSIYIEIIWSYANINFYH